MNKNIPSGYIANNEDPAAPNNAAAPAMAAAPPGTPMNAAINSAVSAAPSGHVDVNAETLATLSAAAQLLREHIEMLPGESAGGAGELEGAADKLDTLLVNGSNNASVAAERTVLAAAEPVAEEVEAVVRLLNHLPENAANYGAVEQRKYDAAAEVLALLAGTGARLVKKGVKAAGSFALNKTRRVATVVGKKATVLIGKSVAGLGSASFAVGKGLANIASSLSAAIRLRAAHEYGEFVRGRDLLARENIGNVPVLVRALQNPAYAAAAEVARRNEARQARLEHALNGLAALRPRAPVAQRRALVEAVAAHAEPLYPAAALNAGVLGGPLMGEPAPPPGNPHALVYNANEKPALVAAAPGPPPPPGGNTSIIYQSLPKAPARVAASQGPPPTPDSNASLVYDPSGKSGLVAAAPGPPPPPGGPANLGVARGRPRREPVVGRLEYNERINMNARYNKEELLAEARRRGIAVNNTMRKETLLDRILQNMVDNGEVRRPGLGGTRRKLNKKKKTLKHR
jgi:hypothetical protein